MSNDYIIETISEYQTFSETQIENLYNLFKGNKFNSFIYIIKNQKFSNKLIDSLISEYPYYLLAIKEEAFNTIYSINKKIDRFIQNTDVDFDREYLDIIFLYSFVGGYVQAIQRDAEDGSNNWGIINIEGKIIIPFGYKWISSVFRGNKFIVRDKEKLGVVDTKYNEIIPIKYDALEELGNDWYRVKLGNKWGVIDSKNNIILSIKYFKVSNSFGTNGEIYAKLDSTDDFKKIKLNII